MKLHTVKEELGSLYFDLISDMPKCNGNGEFFSTVANHLANIVNQSYIAIYIYDEWEAVFKLVGVNEQGKSLFQPSFMKDIQGNPVLKQQIFTKTTDTPPYLIHYIHLELDTNLIGYMIFGSETNENELVLESHEAIKELTENFIKTLQYFHKNKESKHKLRFLYDLSYQLDSTINKTVILEKIIEDMKFQYPGLTVYLFLSQDIETTSLPIKSLEYDEQGVNEPSTRAFLSGTTLLDNHHEGNRLYAPLKGKQGVYGVLEVIAPADLFFPKKEINFISQLAKVAGKAIENTTLIQNSNRLVTDLRLINETSRQLNSNLNVCEIIKLLKGKIAERCKYSQIGIIHKANNDSVVQILEGSTEYFYTEAGTALVNDLFGKVTSKNDGLIKGNYADGVLQFRSLMAVPMQYAGVSRAMIVLLHEKPYYFTFESFKIVQALIGHSTLALSNTILKEKLEHAAITDYLTKLHTRAYLDDRIKEHMEVGKMGSLVLFDIDDFKKINDHYGHHIGDRVLVQVANILCESIRSHDIAARWGGEELAIYLHECNISDSEIVAERILAKVTQLTNPRVTLSAGVAMWSCQQRESVVNLFICADKALYEAKHAGKNKVIPYQ
ncbi:diguanylate cyclase domain-containing protein [Virgibacillus soli]